MDYKEKYEQALENIKKIKAANKDNKELMDFIEYQYPELKESDDEKIKNEIIDYLKGFIPHHNDDLVAKSKLWITWLEKQGEQKTVSKTEPIIEGLTTEFQKQVSHLIASAINKEHEYNEGFVKWTANALLNYAKHELKKQGEQKSAWSEEDERYYDSTLWHIKNSSGREGSVYNWLKSLKERYTWKPSDEQMNY